LVEERAGQVILAKINVDESQNLASVFSIESIPAVKAIRDGKIVLEFVGLLPEPALREFLDRLSPSESERRIQQARELETTDPTQAEALYRQALQEERPADTARVGLARLLIARGEEAEAADLLRRVPPGGEESSEVDRLNAILFLKERAPDCGDEAALRKRLAAEPDNAEVYYQLGCVLAAAGHYPEALKMLLSAAERDKKLGNAKVREVMVKVFTVIGQRSELSEEYRDRLRMVLY
jgi:putative thioredoxin